MSREKMLQAEIALKDEQLADLKKEVERLRRQTEESEKRAAIADASESKITELKRTIDKLVPAAKKTVQYAADLNETRRLLSVVEAEQNDLAKNRSITGAQTAALESALAEAQSDACNFDVERKTAARQARKAEAATQRAKRQKLMTIFVAALLCAGTIGGSYGYVRAALAAPAELSDEAAAAFKQYAPEFRRIVELATQSEREKLEAERAHLAAERNRYQAFDDNTVWDKIISYGWLALIFCAGFIIGVITIIALFVFPIR